MMKKYEITKEFTVTCFDHKTKKIWMQYFNKGFYIFLNNNPNDLNKIIYGDTLFTAQNSMFNIFELNDGTLFKEVECSPVERWRAYAVLKEQDIERIEQPEEVDETKELLKKIISNQNQMMKLLRRRGIKRVTR